MGQLRRRRPTDDSEELRAASEGAAPTPLASHQQRMLGLQRDAGNAAVSGLLSDQSMTVAREADGGAGTERASEGAGPPTKRLTIVDLVDGTPILSVRRSDRRSSGGPGGGTSGAGEKAPADATYELTLPIGPDTTALLQASLRGQRLASATIELGGGVTITLTNVYVTSVSVGAEVASVSLAFDTEARS